jgi:hypothetical protein
MNAAHPNITQASPFSRRPLLSADANVTIAGASVDVAAQPVGSARDERVAEVLSKEELLEYVAVLDCVTRCWACQRDATLIASVRIEVFIVLLLGARQ